MLDEPQVRFFENPSGHRIAYAVHGKGPPLVCAAWWVSHVEADWSHSGFQQFFGALAQHHTVVRYDRHGAGLSDRDRDQVDIETETTTLVALVDHLGFEKTSLFALACAGPPALRFAHEQPDRVDRLVFFGSYARGGDLAAPPVQDAMSALVRTSWGVGARALTDLFAPDLDPDARKKMGAAQRRAASAEMSAKLLGLTFSANVQAEAREVTHPALVLHRVKDRAIPFAAGRELAASLPNATFKSLEGDAHVPWFGDVDAASEAVLEFLGARDASSPTPGTPASYVDRSMERVGELWRLTFENKSVHLPHARGLGDLAMLLARPGEEIHVSVLWAGPDGATQQQATTQPVLDEQARAEYRHRLAQLEERIEDAHAREQVERAEALLEEKDALVTQLRAAVGLGGRDRRLDDGAERARKAVSARIRSSLKKISTLHPALAEHLESHLVTGTYCCYGTPADPAWTLR